MPHPGRSGSDRETVRRLIEAAAHEFARHGYAATRIRDIVDAAGVNLSAVNYHFGGKEGLYHATLSHLAATGLAHLPPEPAEGSVPDAERALRSLVKAMLMRYLGDQEAAPLARIMAHELLDPTPAFAMVVRSVSGPQWAQLLAIISTLLGPGASEEEIALASLSTASQWAFYLFGRRLFEFQFPALASASDAVDRLADHIAASSMAAIEASRARIAAGSRPGRASQAVALHRR